MSRYFSLFLSILLFISFQVDAASRLQCRAFFEFQKYSQLNEAEKAATEYGVHFVGELEKSSAAQKLEILNTVLAELVKIPPFMRELVSATGGRVDLTFDNVTNHPKQAHLKGKRVEKWTSYGTYDSCAGLACSTVSIISVKSDQSGPIEFASSGSINLVLHEYAHTFEHAINVILQTEMKNSALFLQAHSQSIWKTEYERINPEEGWAEALAEYFHSAESRRQLRQEKPLIVAYFEKLFSDRIQLSTNFPNLSTLVKKASEGGVARQALTGYAAGSKLHVMQQLQQVEINAAKALLKKSNYTGFPMALGKDAIHSSQHLSFGYFTEIRDDGIVMSVIEYGEYKKYIYTWDSFISIHLPDSFVQSNQPVQRSEQINLLLQTLNKSKEAQFTKDHIDEIRPVSLFDKEFKRLTDYGQTVIVRTHSTEGSPAQVFFGTSENYYSSLDLFRRLFKITSGRTNDEAKKISYDDIAQVYVFEPNLIKQSVQTFSVLKSKLTPDELDSIGMAQKEFIDARVDLNKNMKELETGDQILVSYRESMGAALKTKLGFMTRTKPSENSQGIEEFHVHFFGEPQPVNLLNNLSLLESLYIKKTQESWTYIEYVSRYGRGTRPELAEKRLEKKLAEGKPVHVYVQFLTLSMRDEPFLAGELISVNQAPDPHHKILVIVDNQGVTHGIDLAMVSRFHLHYSNDAVASDLPITVKKAIQYFRTEKMVNEGSMFEVYR